MSLRIIELLSIFHYLHQFVSIFAGNNEALEKTESLAEI